MKKLLFILTAIVLSHSGFCQCPPYGSTDDPDERKLNIAKNKSARFYSSKVPQKVALNIFITSRREDDRKKFFPGAYVVTEGYLISSKAEGGESCNCGEADTDAKKGDVHIYLGLVPNAPKKHCIVVEITPSFKKLHPDYKTLLVKNQKVKVYGYLLYDYLHEKNSVNFCETCTGTGIWRKTCWEIHPVVKIEPVN